MSPIKVLCSHYVPKRHIERFKDENGNIIITHDFGNKEDLVRNCKELKLLGMNNFYDYFYAPSEYESNEKRYERIEKKLGDEIDRLINNQSVQERHILQYVSFLDSRSLSKRLVIEEYSIYRYNPVYSDSPDPVKQFHQNLIDSSLYYLSTYPIQEYRVRIIHTAEDYELYTSDAPVVEYPRVFLKQIVKNYPEDLPDYPVFICPINPHTAIICIHQSDYVTDQLIQSGYFSSKRNWAINALILGSSKEAVCSTHPLTDYDRASLVSSDHPRNQYLAAFFKTRSKAPKRIRPKYLK